MPQQALLPTFATCGRVHDADSANDDEALRIVCTVLTAPTTTKR
jgi:hypothetical protein